jgi:hypothetical protein
MQISVTELHEIQRAECIAGADAAMDEVCSQLPSMLDAAVKVALEARKAAKRSTRPVYPGRSVRKPTLRPVS